MYLLKKILTYQESVNRYLEVLEDTSEELFRKPISEGKWGISEIIAHIINWDKYLLYVVIPSVKKDVELAFPEFDSFHKTAYPISKNFHSKEEALMAFKTIRNDLCKVVADLSDSVYYKPLVIGGKEVSPHSNLSYSLDTIFADFSNHDQHHLEQIKLFFNS